MKSFFWLIAAVMVLCPTLVCAQYYPGRITEYTIGRPLEKKLVKIATKAQLNAVERMRSESKEPLDIKYNENSVPYLISGKFTIGTKASAGEEAAVKKFLNEHKDIFRMRDAEGELRTRSNEIDRSGLRTIRFAQQHNGISVYGGDLVANFDKEGNLTSVNGNYLPEISVDTTPAITAEEAVGVAKGARGLIDDDIHNTIGPELMIYPVDGAYHLAWCLTLVAKRPFAEWKCFVDAKTGTIIDKWNDTKYQTAATLTGSGVLNESLSVNGCYGTYYNCYWLDICDFYLAGYSGYGLYDISKPMYRGGSQRDNTNQGHVSERCCSSILR
jgi:Zn-dependent metalloprotease